VHPVIRLASFTLLLLGLATTNHQILLIITLPWLLWLWQRYRTRVSILPLLKRLRWLWLSLLILHLWFSSPEFSWIPAPPTVLQAGERMLALIMMVLAAQLLVATTPPPLLIATLQWWFTPLLKLGVPTERLAVRLALVLDTVQAVQQLYTETEARVPVTSSSTSRLTRISGRVADLFAKVLEYADKAPLQNLEIPELRSPPLWQWGYPILMLVIIFYGEDLITF